MQSTAKIAKAMTGHVIYARFHPVVIFPPEIFVVEAIVFVK